MPELQTLLTGLAFGESPRWHDGRLWVADWGAQEIIAVNLEGKSEVIVKVSFPSFPMCFDWLPDGQLLIVSSRNGLLLRMESGGSLVTHADLSSLSEKGHPWNEIVIDGRGNAYINNQGFDFPGGEFAPGTIALLTPDGAARQVADGIAFPNGMAVTPDNSTWLNLTAISSRPLILKLPAASQIGEYGQILAKIIRTGFASMLKVLSGTPTLEASVACASVKVERCYKRSSLIVDASLVCSAELTERRCSW